MIHMTSEELARAVIELAGGRDNIISAINCMTRVRILVRSDEAVNDNELKKLKGVLAVNHSQNGYLEVVVGPGKSRECILVFRSSGIPGAQEKTDTSGGISGIREDKVPSVNISHAGGPQGIQRLMKIFGQIFAPMIPGVIAAGICAGIASFISQAFPGYLEQPALVVVYNLLSGISSAFMLYLTAWAGYRSAEVFGGTPILGGMVGMFTVLGNVDSISAAAGLFNEAQPLTAILRAGRGGVLAAIIGVWMMCRIETFIRRRMPGALDVVFSPLLTILAALVPYVFVIMPVIGTFSSLMCRLIGAVAMSPSPVIRMAAGYLGAAFFLPMVTLGMHHGLIALYTVQLETFGYVTLYPALAMAGAGQVGAAAAIAVKAKKAGNKELVQIINGALPAGILGVGEPLIYGVTLPLGKPFITAGAGAGLGGAFVMLMQVASTTWGPAGILGIFVMTEGPGGAAASVTCYVIGLAISCLTAFAITFMIIKEKDIR